MDQLSTIAIEDLNDKIEHRSAVADRLWHAWWEPYGSPLSEVEAALGEVLAAEQFPFTLVATRDGQFLGTVTGIQSDIFERPDLGPCLAALWVEPEMRGKGLARLLMSAVLARLTTQGFSRVYLSAKPHLHSFYGLAGWSLIESDVGEDHLGIFQRGLTLVRA